MGAVEPATRSGDGICRAARRDGGGTSTLLHIPTPGVVVSLSLVVVC